LFSQEDYISFDNKSRSNKMFMKKFMLAILVINAFTANAQWSELGGTNGLSANGIILSICTDPSGKVYAAGEFKNGNGYYYVAQYNGTSWGELGGTNLSAANGQINAICSDTFGDIFAGGNFKDGGGDYYIPAWDGQTSSWITVITFSPGNNIYAACTDRAGNLYAGGAIKDASNYDYVAAWLRASNYWNELENTNALDGNGIINAVCSDTSADVFVGGDFTNSSGNRYVAEWNGSTYLWSELGGNNSLAANGNIFAVCTDRAGNVYAGGDFSNGNSGNYHYYVAKWNGTNWSQIGSSFNGQIYALCTDRAGNVYAGGHFTNGGGQYYVAKFDGTSWTELGGTNSLGANQYIFTLATDSLDNIYAAGQFTNGSGKFYVAKYGNFVTPVKLISFTAATKNDDALLQWATAQEENSSYFSIQRSTDGTHFADIAKVSAAGNSSMTKEYSYLDQNISTLSSNIIYYRLAEKDEDGTSTLSEIKAIHLNNAGITFSVYPNPASDVVHIISSSDIPDAALKIISINGSVLYETKQSFVAGQQIQIPLSKLPPQVLTLSISSQNSNQRFKIVKK